MGPRVPKDGTDSSNPSAEATDHLDAARREVFTRQVKPGDRVSVSNGLGLDHTVVKIHPQNSLALLHNPDPRHQGSTIDVSASGLYPKALTGRIKIGDEVCHYDAQGHVIRWTGKRYEKLCEYSVKPLDQLYRKKTPGGNPNSFDRVHAVDKDCPMMQGETSRVLKPDGTMIVSRRMETPPSDLDLPNYQGDKVENLKFTRHKGSPILIDREGNVIKQISNGQLKLVLHVKAEQIGDGLEPATNYLDKDGRLRLPTDRVVEYESGAQKIVTPENILVRRHPGLKGASQPFTEMNPKTTEVTIDGNPFHVVEETGAVLERQPDGSFRQRVEFECPQLKKQVAGSTGSVPIETKSPVAEQAWQREAPPTLADVPSPPPNHFTAAEIAQMAQERKFYEERGNLTPEEQAKLDFLKRCEAMEKPTPAVEGLVKSVRDALSKGKGTIFGAAILVGTILKLHNDSNTGDDAPEAEFQ